MTREDRITLNKSLGLAVEWLEAMTDAEYEAERDFQEEKALRGRMYRNRYAEICKGMTVR